MHFPSKQTSGRTQAGPAPQVSGYDAHDPQESSMLAPYSTHVRQVPPEHWESSMHRAPSGSDPGFA
jgi:hypothetical protein